MFFITKYKHNEIVAQYKTALEDSRQAIYRKEKFEEIVGKLTDKVVGVVGMCGAATAANRCNVMSELDSTVAVYVDDYFGGKVIKQEATAVTILDTNGKATYGVTARKLPKGKNYHLVIN